MPHTANRFIGTSKRWIAKALCQAAVLGQVIARPGFAKSFVIPSHLTCQERMLLFRLASGGGIIVEVGSYIGASACCFGAAVLAAGTGKVICIDTWNNDAMTEGKRDTWQTFQDNTRLYRDVIVPIRGFSTEVVQTVSEVTPRLDILFIDGDHSYSGVKADWEAYKGFLKQGATVIFHDYGWAEGVRRVVHEDVMPIVNHQDSLPNMWWGRKCRNP